MSYEFDLLVIGAGSGGVRAARIAAGHGARVGIIEAFRYGGTCVMRGCIPKKLFSYAAGFQSDFADSAGFGWKLQAPGFDWRVLVENKNRELARLEDVYRSMLRSAGVQMFDGYGSIVDAHSVTVNGKTLSARVILIATGGTPERLGIPGDELAITSNEVFDLPSLPRRVLVVGGGYIACEMSSIFRGLGSSVTQMLRGDRILRGFDDDVRSHLTAEMEKHGIEFAAETRLQHIAQGKTGLHLTTDRGGSLEVDCVLLAVGRVPNTRELGLQKLGVMMAANGAIVVDEQSRTSVDSIYAVGDVTGRIALTPVALAEGHAFADSLFGGRPRVADHRCVPSAVFSLPNVAVVGLTEEEAIRSHEEVTIYRSNFRPLKQTLAAGPGRTMMKLVVDARSDKVLGCHMVGEHAGEIIQGFAVALKMGATKADLDATIGIHPTAAEEFVTMRQATRSVTRSGVVAGG